MNNKNFILIILLLIISYQTNAVVYVGEMGDLDCDFNDLQLAIDSGDNEVYLSKNIVLNGSYDLGGDISIIGGFDDCSDSTINSDGSITQIKGLASGSILNIQTGDSLSHITLQNLDVNDAVDGSAIDVRDFSGTLSLIDSNLHTNINGSGAGIYIRGISNVERPTLRILNSKIQQNIANHQGGGVYCRYANIIIDSTSLIARNEVFDGSGGGLYSNQCNVDVYAGHIDGESAGFIGNKSTNKGAGIYASQSELNINGQQEDPKNPVYGNNLQPVLFKENISDSDQDGNGYGAAMYLSQSDVMIKAVWFDGNKGSELGIGDHNRGSVFHAEYASTVTMTRDESQACWRKGLCNLLSNNLHVAIYAQRPGTVVSIYDTEIINNTANFTGLIWARNGCCLDSGFGPTLNFENNLVHQNNSTNSGLIKTDSDNTNHCCELEINILNNTISHNNFAENHSVIDINSDVTLNMHNNIIYENSNIDVLDNLEFVDPVAINISCLLAHELDSVPTVTSTIFIDDPLFNDPMNNDYHITGESPAIDVCSNSIYTPFRLDMDQQSQGVDDPDVGNLEGVYDLGVDEFHNIIFNNGFE